MASTHDLIVLGAGSGGLATAFRAASHGARVALLEPNLLGGTCVNVGCVPKKAMWYAAEAAETVELARQYGFALTPGALDWPGFIARRQAYIDRIHASYRRRLDAAHIEVIPAEGHFVDAHTIRTGERALSAPHVVIATGAHPRRLALPGFALGTDSDGFFTWQACPRRVAIVGGGYIGVELAGVLRALGTEVELFARSRLLRAFDEEMTTALGELMRKAGIGVHEHANVRGAEGHAGAVTLKMADAKDMEPFDALLWAVGRAPSSVGLDLRAAGVAIDASGFVTTDTFQNTNVDGVYALGDITARLALTPVAIAAGRKLADRLFANQADAHLDYTNVPSVVFAHPPLASVGLSEVAARAHWGDEVHCYRSRFAPMQRALSDSPYQSLLKLVCTGADERVVGIHILGPGADEMIQGFAVAVKMGARKADLDATLPVHPTSAEELVLMH